MRISDWSSDVCSSDLKSSLLRMMYLAQHPSAGRVALFGRDVAGLSRRETALLRRRIGVVFQDFRLLDHLPARENVALPLRICGQSGASADKARRVKEVQHRTTRRGPPHQRGAL